MIWFSETCLLDGTVRGGRRVYVRVLLLTMKSGCAAWFHKWVVLSKWQEAAFLMQETGLCSRQCCREDGWCRRILPQFDSRLDKPVDAVLKETYEPLQRFGLPCLSAGFKLCDWFESQLNYPDFLSVIKTNDFYLCNQVLMQSLCVAYRLKLKFFLLDSPFGGVSWADAAISGLG